MRRKRILYLSSTGNHDFRFLEKFKEVENEWETVFCTFNARLLETTNRIGIETVNLNQNNLPFDDWDRGSDYNFLERAKLKRHFLKHRANLKAFIERFKPDIVHSGWLQTDSFIAATEKSTPLVVAEWGSDLFLRPYDNQRNFKKTKWTLAQADLVLCDCKYAEVKVTEILGKQPKALVTFPWGIDLQQFNSENRLFNKPDPLKCIVVKNLVPVSSLHTLFEALAKIAKHASHYDFSIYGEGALESDLKQQCRRLGLDKQVQFLGYIDNGRLPEILKKHDLFVSCNLSEGTSLALMEAMACGVLPIATKIPAYQEWITSGHNGFLSPPADADALAENLTKVRNLHVSEFNEMRKINLGISQAEFNWNKNFEKLLRSYHTLIN